MSALYERVGNRYREASTSVVCEQASRYVFDSVAKTRPNLSSPSAAKDFLRHQAGLDHEQFGVIYLDKRHRAINVEILSKGTIDGASVYPREVVKRCLAENAAAVILFHNHPSGVAEPSQADEMITNRLRDALALMDIRLIDHLIIAGTSICSLAERGLV